MAAALTGVNTRDIAGAHALIKEYDGIIVGVTPLRHWRHDVLVICAQHRVIWLLHVQAPSPTNRPDLSEFEE